MFLTVSVCVCAVSYFRYSDYVDNTAEIAEQSNLSTSAQVTAQVSDIRRRVSVFVDEHQKQLQDLAGFPTIRKGMMRFSMI